MTSRPRRFPARLKFAALTIAPVKTRIKLAAFSAIAVVAFTPTVAEAATRPVTCGPVWTMGGGYATGIQVQIRVQSWNIAPEVHRNVPCSRVLRTARKIVRTAGTQTDGLMYTRTGPRGDEYYGGHGFHMRIRYLSYPSDE